MRWRGERRFRKRSWHSRVDAADGWSVWIASRFVLVYLDAEGEVRCHGEADGVGTGFTIDHDSLADLPAGRREVVLARAHEAFDFAGWPLGRFL